MRDYPAGLLSVTEVLRLAGLIDTAWYTDAGRDRGTAVHLACQFLDEGDLDEGSVDPEISGYLDGYRKFKSDRGVAPEWIETPLFKANLYAGTPDRVFVTRPRSLWDLKTGAPQGWHALQAAAYVHLLDDPCSYSRFGLYLKGDGSYSVREFPKGQYFSDLNVFLSALNLANWKRLHP